MLHGWTDDLRLYSCFRFFKPGAGGNDFQDKSIPMCKMQGYVLRFCAPLVDRMPDAVVQDLVAHELAHVCQEVGNVRQGRDLYTKGAIEEDADQTIEWWGFDADSVDRWAVEQGLVKV